MSKGLLMSTFQARQLVKLEWPGGRLPQASGQLPGRDRRGWGGCHAHAATRCSSGVR